jgi:hypothetical protein
MLRKTKKHIGWFLICCGLLHQASAQNTDKKYNSPGDWTQAFDVAWESRWQQSGIPQGVVRWSVNEPRVLSYSINASATSSNAQRAREALSLVAEQAGFGVQELASNAKNAQITFDIKRFTTEELSQSICFMQPHWRNWEFSTVRIVASEQFAYKCLLHELLHAFGFPGHPHGDTVLSYFEGNQQSLKPMDKFFLKAWYSAAIKPAMAAPVAARTLNRLWIEENVGAEYQESAKKLEQEWFDLQLTAMEAFAFGKGEPPRVLYRSGRLSPAGLQRGLSEIQNILAHAFLSGAYTKIDLAKAAKLSLLASQNGNAVAANMVVREIKNGAWSAIELKSEALALCDWLGQSNETVAKLKASDVSAARESETCRQIVR